MPIFKNIFCNFLGIHMNKNMNQSRTNQNMSLSHTMNMKNLLTSKLKKKKIQGDYFFKNRIFHLFRKPYEHKYEPKPYNDYETPHYDSYEPYDYYPKPKVNAFFYKSLIFFQSEFSVVICLKSFSV